MRRLAIALASAVLIAGAGCSQDSVRSGQAVVEIDEGSRVLIGERNQGLKPAEGRRTVQFGAQVKVLAGSASVELEDGARLEVREGSEVRLGSPIVLDAEDLLVTAGKSSVKVSAGGSEVTVFGVARVTRDLAVSAAAYRGTVTMHSAARTLEVPALRQAEVPSLGVLPLHPEPLRYKTADPWDRRYLGTAMDLTDQLESRSHGFTSSLRPGEGQTPGFYRLLIPALEDEPAFNDDALREGRDAGETLVGAAIAVAGKQGTFVERWTRVFTFKDEGATWGLVALDQQVSDPGALVHTVDVAIGSKPAAESFAFILRPTTAPPVVVTPVAPVPAETPTPAPAAPAPRAPAPARPAPATPPAAQPPLITLPELPTLIPAPNTDQPGILTPLLDTVTGLLDGLLAPK